MDTTETEAYSAQKRITEEDIHRKVSPFRYYLSKGKQVEQPPAKQPF
jgi:hypothetical protein